MEPRSRPSDPPSARGSAAKGSRPWYLAVAMIATWVLGVFGAWNGCASVAILRDGHLDDPEVIVAHERFRERPVERVYVLGEAAAMQATIDHRRVTFPISVAKLLLGALLALASGLALVGRPGSRGLALQATVAFAALLVLEYALTRPVREAAVAAGLRAAATLPEGLEQREVLMRPSTWWWLLRIRNVGIEVFALALAALALTRARTVSYFQAVERSIDRTSLP